MRIHTNTLIRQDFTDFTDAARKAGVDIDIVELSEHSSQSRLRAFNFTLSGSGAHRSQWASSDHKAATWDEWGIFLAHLFDVDAQAHCGKNNYLSAEHFHWATGDRFRTLTPAQQHKRHKWNYLGPVVTGSYAVAECDCGAIQRWTHKWEEISA